MFEFEIVTLFRQIENGTPSEDQIHRVHSSGGSFYSVQTKHKQTNKNKKVCSLFYWEPVLCQTGFQLLSFPRQAAFSQYTNYTAMLSSMGMILQKLIER